jgi:hypothetical protein
MYATLCNNAERPETITVGSNELIEIDLEVIKPAMEILFSIKLQKVLFFKSR